MRDPKTERSQRARVAHEKKIAGRELELGILAEARRTADPRAVAGAASFWLQVWRGIGHYASRATLTTAVNQMTVNQ